VRLLRFSIALEIVDREQAGDGDSSSLPNFHAPSASIRLGEQ